MHILEQENLYRQEVDCLPLVDLGGNGRCLEGMEFFLGEGECSKIDSGDGCTTKNILKKLELCTLNVWIVCESYLIKVVKNAWKITSVSDQKPRKEPQTTPKESRREDNWARKGSSQQPAEHDLVFGQEKMLFKRIVAE